MEVLSLDESRVIDLYTKTALSIGKIAELVGSKPALVSLFLDEKGLKRKKIKPITVDNVPTLISQLKPSIEKADIKTNAEKQDDKKSISKPVREVQQARAKKEVPKKSGTKVSQKADKSAETVDKKAVPKTTKSTKSTKTGVSKSASTATKKKQKTSTGVRKVSEPTNSYYTDDEKEEYCDKKYGRGRWKFMSRSEFIEMALIDLELSRS